MNANKLFSEFSIKKIWDKLKQHDKALNATMLVLSSGNWTENSDGTFTNTIPYSSFKETDRLTVELYEDETLSETVYIEYCAYISGFEVVDGALIATAYVKPTQTMTVVVKGDFESVVQDMSDINARIDQCFQSGSDFKARVASGITAKKVPTNATDSVETILANLASIATGSGNAAKADVLSGKTFTNDDGVEYTGEMANNGGTTKSATGSLDSTNKRVQLAIPVNGFYNTSSKLYIAYATLANLIGLTAAKIVKGNTILGIAGTAVTAGTPTVKVLKSSFGNGEPTLSYTTTAAYKILIAAETGATYGGGSLSISGTGVSEKSLIANNQTATTTQVKYCLNAPKGAKVSAVCNGAGGAYVIGINW